MNVFDTVAVDKPKYSTFDLSFDHKLSTVMGRLTPVYLQECLPGDKFHISSEAMFRMMPMVAPIMHKVDITFHHFFCPNRILWENWETYITGGEQKMAPADIPAHPVISPSQQVNPFVEASSLANYLGVPVWGSALDPFVKEINALPFAAYQRIYKEYYRDQNMEAETDSELIDGLQNLTEARELFKIRNRAWEHDYFTSALPYAQKGDAVNLPLEFADVPVKWQLSANQQSLLRDANTGALIVGGATYTVPAVPTAVAGVLEGYDAGGPTGTQVQYDPDGSLYVDGDEFKTTTTINDLRTAWALQQWLEKNMRSGSRYRESLEAHFDVKSRDARLDRPEYIGGSKGTVSMAEVLQTSSTDGTSPQGSMAGHGVSVFGSETSHYKCDEHGWIITICSIMPKTAYYQGLPRMFDKKDRTEYAWPDFATLGEQEIRNYELYFDETDLLNEDSFGYIPRYAEYRYNSSRVSGQMSTTLDHWHMARKFGARPTLSKEFIISDPTTRIFADTEPEDDSLVGHVFMKVAATRPLPMFGIPAMLV